jgi:DNA-binding NtrC family response regulator
MTTFKLKYNKPDLHIPPSLVETLTDYEWPGNVRELKHMVERAVILAEEKELSPRDFSLESKPQKNRADFNLESREAELIAEALEASEANLSRASVLLGISRATLYRKMEKYGL